MPGDTSDKEQKQPLDNPLISPWLAKGDVSGEAKDQPPNDTENTDQTDKEPDDLIAVRDFLLNPKNSNVITAIATGVICITGIVYTAYAGLQWQETRRSADAAKSAAGTAANQLELTERPWISVENVSFPKDHYFVFDKQVIMTDVSVSIKNVGHSPATQIEVKVQLFMSRNRSFLDAVKDICKEASQDSSTPLEGETIFPDKTGTTVEYPARLPAGQVSRYWAQRDTFQVIGCAAYRSVVSREVYYTGFVYDLLMPKYPETPTPAGIPENDMSLRSPLAGFIAK